MWPESQSFRDDPHLGPIPSSWRGTCVGGDRFEPDTACNRKLIGARYYHAGFEHELGPLNTSGGAEYRSPRDRAGHGTHTASTTVGAVAPNASYFGLARGTARARLAVYKVCVLVQGPHGPVQRRRHPGGVRRRAARRRARGVRRRSARPRR
jgi:subtilisin family serine protease